MPANSAALSSSPWWNSRGPRCERRPDAGEEERRRRRGTSDRSRNEAGGGRRRNPLGRQDLAREIRYSSSQMTRVDFLLAPRSRTKSCLRGPTRVPPRTARLGCAARRAGFAACFFEGLHKGGEFVETIPAGIADEQVFLGTDYSGRGCPIEEVVFQRVGAEMRQSVDSW